MTSFIKFFPEYEDVFYDDIENHKKYFLPICSFNLEPLNKEDTWLHIVSVKEIYDGRLGQDTEQFHTCFTKHDRLGFDIIGGKYKFDASWNYFTVAKEIMSSDYGDAHTEKEIACNMNDAMYQLKKSYYKKFGKLYDKVFGRRFLDVGDIRALERLRQLTAEDLEKDKFCEYSVQRLKDKTLGIFDHGYLTNLSLEPNKEVFDYIASIEGYDFQYTAPDAIALFYGEAQKKAVICLDYT